MEVKPKVLLLRHVQPAVQAIIMDKIWGLQFKWNRWIETLTRGGALGVKCVCVWGGGGGGWEGMQACGDGWGWGREATLSFCLFSFVSCEGKQTGSHKNFLPYEKCGKIYTSLLKYSAQAIDYKTWRRRQSVPLGLSNLHYIKYACMRTCVRVYTWLSFYGNLLDLSIYVSVFHHPLPHKSGRNFSINTICNSCDIIWWEVSSN